MRVLGIETSCDETGVALYEAGVGIRAERLASQISLHAAYGGVVPELASRDHIAKLLPMVETVLEDAQIELGGLDAIAYTAGPGLIGALMVGGSLASSLAYATVMSLHDGLSRTADTAIDELPGTIGRTRTYIDQHLAERLDVERLAEIAGLSRAHFVRVFTKSVGQSPASYVASQRLQLAQRLLTATDAAILEVAAACGFADANYFAKVFRRMTDATPTAFRSNRLGPLGGSSS